MVRKNESVSPMAQAVSSIHARRSDDCKGFKITAIAALLSGLSLLPMNAQATDFISDTVVVRVIGNSDGETAAGEQNGAIITSDQNFSTDNSYVNGDVGGNDAWGTGARAQSYIKVMSTNNAGGPVTGGYIDMVSTGAVNVTSDNSTLTLKSGVLTQVIGDFSVKKTTGSTSVFSVDSDTGETTVTGTLDVTGASSTHGINNNTSGITNAGAISGATTISASGLISTTGGIQGVGISSTGGLSNSGGVFNNSNQGITNAGAISASSLDAGSGTIQTTGAIQGGTGTFTTLNSITINNSGMTSTGALSVTNNASVGGDLSVTGTSTLYGATTIDDTLNVTGLTTTAGINNTGALNQEGATSINASANYTTSINTGTSTGNITVGNSANVTNLNSATNNIGVNAYATTNNIGTNAAAASTNTIGNTNVGSTLTERAGNSTVSLANNAASLGVGGGGSVSTNTTSATLSGAGTLATNSTTGILSGTTGALSVFNAAQTIGDGTTINNTLSGLTYQNKINGNTYVDGNMYINGSLNYVSSNSATTTVVGGSSILANPTQGTSGGTAIVMKVGANAPESRAMITLTNGINTTNGLEIYENRTIISGGATGSSTLSLSDTGATLNSKLGNNVINAATGSNTMQAQTGNAISTATGNNTITATTGSNVIQAQTGNTMATATGNNSITATTGSNVFSANAANQSNWISAIGSGGINNITANAENGVNNLEAKTNNIGVATAASINTIGNTNAATTVSSYGGTGYNVLTNASSTFGTNAALNGITGGMVQTNATTASIRASNSGPLASNGSTGVMAVGAGGGYTAFATTQSTGTGTIGGVVDNKNLTNKINGNTYIDGNVYINGTLDYVSSNSANTTVIGASSATSILANATQSITSGTAIVLKDSTGTQTVVDRNGKLTNINGTAQESTAALTLTNGIGNTHGLVVTETQATLSGGSYSSSMTLNDNGATFSNSANGAPIQVHGVADGTSDFDAVNYRQLRGVAAGVAGTSAMANIPQVDQNKTLAVGVGLGNFQGMTALALGGSYRAGTNAVLKASVSTVGGIKKSTVVGAGAGFSW